MENRLPVARRGVRPGPGALALLLLGAAALPSEAAAQRRSLAHRATVIFETGSPARNGYDNWLNVPVEGIFVVCGDQLHYSYALSPNGRGHSGVSYWYEGKRYFGAPVPYPQTVDYRGVIRFKTRTVPFSNPNTTPNQQLGSCDGPQSLALGSLGLWLGPKYTPADVQWLVDTAEATQIAKAPPYRNLPLEERLAKEKEKEEEKDEEKEGEADGKESEAARAERLARATALREKLSEARRQRAEAERVRAEQERARAEAERLRKEEEARRLAALRTVRIGTQEWMVQNLDVDRFRNGDPIPVAKDVKDIVARTRAGQPLIFNADGNAAAGNSYNRPAILDPRGLCPTGFRVPTTADWMKLVNHLGGARAAGAKLAGGSWELASGTNASGFTGLPFGYGAWRENKGEQSEWWSTDNVTANGSLYSSTFQLRVTSEDSPTLYIVARMSTRSPDANVSFVRCLKN